MEILFAVMVVAALLMPIELLRSPRSWPSRVPDPTGLPALVDHDEPLEAAGDGPGEAGEMTMEWGLFTSSLVQRRLEALADELERLDGDPAIFAKAFHTTVARSAYEALLVDAPEFSHQPRGHAVQAFEFDLAGPSTGQCEELDL